MAIFRAGKRIGNMDIRVGLPRDRTLDNVEGDKRIKERPLGGNQQTSIGRFISELNAGEGIARGNRYLVKFYPPKNIEFKTENDNAFFHGRAMSDNVELMCSAVKLPHRDILSHRYVTYGPGRKMPYAYAFGSELECLFMADKFLRQRSWFEMWQNQVFDATTHNMNYYDEYVGSMEVYQLGTYREQGGEHPIYGSEGYSDAHRITYGVRFHEVYPETIGEVQYQSMTDDMIPMDIPVKFAFRSWENITLDSIANVRFGKAVMGAHKPKPAKNYGIFGGILGKMPPEIKRATKTVIGKIKRDIPIGKGTGGRVFPPFEINK